MKKTVWVFCLFFAVSLSSQEIVVEERLLYSVEETGDVDSAFRDFLQTASGKIYFTAEIAFLRKVLPDDNDINAFLPQGDFIFNFSFKDIDYHEETGDIWALAEPQFSIDDWWMYKIEPDESVTPYYNISSEDISQIIVDASGLVWMGIPNNLVSFDPVTNEKIYYNFSSFSTFGPNDMQLTSDQSIWFYKGRRIFRFDGSEFEEMAYYGESSGYQFASLAVADDGVFYGIAKNSPLEDYLLRFSESNPDGEIIEIDCFDTGTKLIDVHFGNHGELWVTGERDSTTVSGENLKGSSLSVLYEGEWICTGELRWKTYSPKLKIYSDYQEGVYIPHRNLGFGESDYPVTLYNARLDGIVGTASYDNMAASVSVFPNPASGSFNVEYSLSGALKVAVHLYDCTGRKVLQKDLGRHIPGSYTETIRLRDVPNGLYFVEVVTGDSRESRRIVINR